MTSKVAAGSGASARRMALFPVHTLLLSQDERNLSAAAASDSLDLSSMNRLPRLYWAAMIGLLVAEVVAVTLRFDAGKMVTRGDWLASLISFMPRFISLAVSIGTMVGLVVVWGLMRGNDEWSGLAESIGRRLWIWVPGHLTAYAGLTWLTWSIFEGPAVGRNPAPWVALWICAGLATTVLWMLAVLPVNSWYALLGRSWRAVLLGVVASVVAVAAGSWTTHLWEPFHRSTFWAVRGVLVLFSHNVFCRPVEFIVGAIDFGVEISSQCSGYEGIGLIWVFLGVFYWWFRHELRFPQALLLIPLATALSWSANVVRIAALILVGAWGWPGVAAGGFHSQAGWLAFNAIALGLVVFARRVPMFSKGEADADGPRVATENPTAAYLGPLIVIALTTMLTGAFSDGGLDRLYPARVLSAAAIFWYFRRNYTELHWSWSWRAVLGGLVVFVIWMALEPAPSRAQETSAVPDLLAKLPHLAAAAWLAMRAVGSVVVIPVAEEFAFRGYLIRRLISADFATVPEGRFTWPSFLVSSFLFGLLHQRWLAGTAAGLLFALIYYQRGKLTDAVLAHATANLSVTLYVFSTGRWQSWS